MWSDHLQRVDYWIDYSTKVQYCQGFSAVWKIAEQESAICTRNWRATTCATPRNCDIIAQFFAFVKGIFKKSPWTVQTHGRSLDEGEAVRRDEIFTVADDQHTPTAVLLAEL